MVETAELEVSTCERRITHRATGASYYVTPANPGVNEQYASREGFKVVKSGTADRDGHN